MRFDFSHPTKLTDPEKEQVEEFVNDALARDLPVRSEELPLPSALESGALTEFGHKYGDVVTVYTITGSGGAVASREICRGHDPLEEGRHAWSAIPHEMDVEVRSFRRWTELSAAD